MNDLLGEVKSQEAIVSDELAAVKVTEPTLRATPPPAAALAAATPATEKKKRFGFLRGRKKEDAAGTPVATGAGVEEDEEEMVEEAAAEPATSNTEFMNEVARVKSLLESIHSKRGDVEQMHERTKTLTRTQEIQETQQRMEKELMLIKKYAGEAKTSIEKMQREDEAVDAEEASGTERMRHTIIAGLMTRLKRELDAFRLFESEVRSEYKDVVERRLRVVTGQPVDEEQVEAMIESGEAETVFRKAMQQQKSTAVVDVLNQTEERYKGMQRLHEDLLNLHQMMLDFATLVNEQGMMIDNIEMQVMTASDFVRDGTNELLIAKGHKKSKEKFKSAAMGVAGGAAAATAATAAVATGAIAAPLAM